MPSKPSAKKTKHKIGKQCINELEISGDIGPTLMGVFVRNRYMSLFGSIQPAPAAAMMN
jgi:hypothetical protein